MTDLYITGVAATPCGKYLDRSPKDIAAEAANGALLDAGITADDVDAVVVGNAVAGLIGGQESIRGQAFLQGTELIGLPVFNVENACASGSSAFHIACQGIKAGTYETVLTIGVEKMTHEDKARSFSALEGALDVEEYPLEDGARKSSIFMDIYAMKAKKYMDAYGASKEDLAKVVSKNRSHAQFNPVAQYRDTMTVEEVLAARPIVEPFTLPMCSPIGDGAAAIVVTTEERAKGHEGAIRIAGTAGASGKPGSGSPAVARAAQAAYEQAGVGPEAMGFAEVHDAAASAELEEIENLGLAAEGEAYGLNATGQTSLGGRIPVNVSGGLISRGHPVGATGALQIFELVTQLRGHAGERQVDNPQFGISQNGGGFIVDDVAAAMVTILAAA